MPLSWTIESIFPQRKCNALSCTDCWCLLSLSLSHSLTLPFLCLFFFFSQFHWKKNRFLKVHHRSHFPSLSIISATRSLYFFVFVRELQSDGKERKLVIGCKSFFIRQKSCARYLLSWENIAALKKKILVKKYESKNGSNMFINLK